MRDNHNNLLEVVGDNFKLEFNKQTGYLTKYEIGGENLIATGGALTPNFWRAPTDNDFGAGLQRKYEAWRKPQLKLTDLKHETTNDKISMVMVEATYDMPDVKGTLKLSYTIMPNGAVMVTEDFKATEGAEVSNLFRYGMQMQMPEEYGEIEYYGRGPIENYSDRNHSTFLGVYNQSVDEQYYPYIRPQETGTKTDVRYWKQLNRAGRGLEFEAAEPFSISALNYSIDSLDDYPDKKQSHGMTVEKTDYVNVCIDKVQMGLGCVNSWGALPLKEYQVPYGDYSFTFVIRPIN